MKKFTAIVAVLFSLMFAFGSTASAQSMADLESMGLDSGYARMFVNMDAAMASPDPSGNSAPMGVMTAVFHFEDASKIDGHLKEFADGFAEGYFEGADYQLAEVKDLGDEAYEVTGTIDMDGTALPSTAVLSQKAEYVFVSITMGANDTAMDKDIVSFMLEANPSDAPVDFQEDGTSTGGAFDMMPTADDIDGLQGMEPMMDMDMLSELTGTPAS